MVDQVLGSDIVNNIIEEMGPLSLTSSNGCPNLIMISLNRKLAAVAASFFRVGFASTHLVA